MRTNSRQMLFPATMLMLLLYSIASPAVLHAATIQLPQTGQATSYTAGDDGALKKGVAWPIPRFATYSTATASTVSDNLTGLMWTKSANLAGLAKNWQQALDYITSLNTGSGYQGHKDWRLPNINELASLLNREQSAPYSWLNLPEQGFIDVQNDYYWSSSNYIVRRDDPNWASLAAWAVNLDNGMIAAYDYGSPSFVWPVRSGISGTLALPQTGQTTCYPTTGYVTTSCANTGQDGDLQKGVALPSPRFTPNTSSPDNSNTITDNLTGLMWPKDPANYSTYPMSWQDALTYINSLNSGSGYAGHTDWRLPNINELSSLLDRGRLEWQSDWLMLALADQGFSNVSPVGYWTSSSNYDSTSNSWSNAWFVHLSDGMVYYADKTNYLTYYVWPVRGVVAAAQTINVTTAAPASAAYNSSFTVAAAASSGLPVTYSSGSAGVCTASGAIFTMIAPTGTCIVQYNQAGNSSYAAATQITSSNTNAVKASQTITFGALAAKTYGDAPFDLTASASSGLTVSYTSSDPTVASISGATVTIHKPGTTTISASQSGDGNYNAAPSVNQTLTVNKAPSVINLAALSQEYDATAKSVTVTTIPSGLATSVTYNGSSTPPSAIGSYSVAVSINDDNFQGSATATLTISDSTPPTGGILSATAAGSNQINLTWTAASDISGVSGYKLVSSTSSVPTDCSGTALYSGSSLSFNDTTVIGGTTYYYRLCAVDAANNWSTGSIATATTALAAPTGVNATLFNNMPKITWGAVSGATSYTIYRSTTSGTLGSVIGSSSTTLYIDSTAQNGTTYFYTVMATSINRVYVANQVSNSVSSFDANASVTSATIGVGDQPVAVAINPTTHRAYVANYFANSVSVIDTDTNVVVATITGVGTVITDYPAGITVDPLTNRVYVSMVGSAKTYVIDGASNTVLTTIPLSGTLAIIPATTKAYISNGTVQIMNTGTNAITGQITVGTDPSGIAVNSLINRAYVANYTSGTVSVIDTTNDTVVGTITVGSNPAKVVINTIKNKVYVLNQGSGTVSVIDVANGNAVSTITADLLGIQPNSLTINAALSRLYVSNWGGASVTVINTENNTPLRTVSVGTGPEGMDFYSYNGATSSQVSALPKATQTITFANPGSQSYGTSPTLTATASSGLAVTFSSTTSGVCTITSGGMLTFVTVGTCSITASQGGDASYNIAPQVTQSFTVNTASQTIGTITFTPITLAVGGTTTVSATGGASGNSVTFGTPTGTICRVSGSLVTGLAAGTCTITADQAGDANYNSAIQVTQNIIIPVPVNGVCGTSNGTPFTVAPSANLCVTGTYSAVSGTGPWTWSCGGSNGGTNASCGAYLQGTLVIPKTGQTLCYNTTGTVIACAGTGQDGNKQAGAAQTDPVFTDSGTTITDKVYGMTWQKDAGMNGATIKHGISGPATRFTDNSDGTVADNLTGLVWLKDAGCFATVGGIAKGTDATTSKLTWPNALTWSNNLKGDNTVCGLIDGSVAGDWRLPNINELASVATNFMGSAPSIWLTSQGFANVQDNKYWSSSNYSGSMAYAWYVVMGDGYVSIDGKSYSYYVWPVRAGQSGSLGTLTISKAGSGSGTVSSDPSRITCGETCTANFAAGQSVVLTATADSGKYFTGWTGCNSTKANQCTVTVTGAKSVSAVFGTNAPPIYTVTYNGNGSDGGTTPSDSTSYFGGDTITALANTGTLVKTGYTFAGWNTQAGGNGTNYSAGSGIFTILANTTLYAKWTVNGACGTSHTQPFTIAPTSNLCVTGTATGVSGTGPWSWTCANSGGTTASCWAYLQGTLVLPKTGQTVCYNAAGTVISCAGTGQDGDKQMGATQTDPVFTDNSTTITDKVYSMTWQKDAGTNGATVKTGVINALATRFTDNGNGTQTDNLTGLVWLKKANCFDAQTWATALNSANTLASGLCNLSDGSVAGDWRLPNINELASLPTNYTGTNPTVWLNNPSQGFANVQSYGYWSGSTSAVNTSNAWVVFMYSGYVDSRIKTDPYYAWPVRSGQSSALGTLTLSKTGSGSISSIPAGITCGAACSASFARGQSVVLTATADSGKYFAGWTGCNSTEANECTVTVTGAKSVTAAFDSSAPTTYAVNYDGNGSDGGTTPSNTTSFLTGDTVTVLANTFTKTGYTFTGWNTASDGSGTSRAAASTFTMGSANVTLYAKWTLIPAMLPQTGQTICYDTDGTSLSSCTGTGQDGALQLGVAWPNPRFTAETDTVTDNLTGVIWTKNANLAAGSKTWQLALDYIKGLNSSNYLGHNDWRLPNVNELVSILNLSLRDQVSWLNDQGFSNVVQLGYYWSSNSNALFKNYAFGMNITIGDVEAYSKSDSYYVWPVRGGSSGSVSSLSISKTGQTTCYDVSGTVISCSGTGQDGELQSGATWPSPRFGANADQTVTDKLSGLVWAKDANLMTTGSPSFDADGTVNDGAVTWQHALDYVNQLNSGNYQGHNDWRLPNRYELASMVNWQQVPNADWLNNVTQGFSNVQGRSYWSSSTNADNALTAWYVDMSFGSTHSQFKVSSFYYVWPVRGGSGLYGNASISASPSSKDFGSVNVGSSSSVQAFTISNSGTNNLYIGAGTLSGTNADQFTKSNDNCSSTTLTPGASCTMQITFSPDIAGTKSATFSLSSNSAGTATTTSVALSGTSVASTYTLSLTKTGSGTGVVGSTAPDSTINCASTCSNTYTSGTSVTLTATPDFGSSFTSWTGCDSTSGNQCTVTVTGAKSVTTTFTLNPNYTVIYNDNNSTGGTIPTDSSSYANGGTITVLGNTGSLTKTGYSFAGWNTAADGSGTNYTAGSDTFNINANTTLYANWTVNNYTLTFTSDGNGTLTGTTSQTITSGGNSSTVTAVPAANYYFVNWTGTNGFVTTSDNPLTITNVISNQTITANFSAVPVAGICGTSTGKTFSGIPTYNRCSVGTATAFSGGASGPWYWQCNGVNGGATGFNCSASKFTFAAGANGSISGATNQTVYHLNSGSAVTATPDPGYYFVNWTGIPYFDATSANPLNVTNKLVGWTYTVTANFSNSAINGVCGNNGGTFTSQESLTLCTSGSATAVTGSGPWSWSCDGINGGTAATCSAAIRTYTFYFGGSGSWGTVGGTSPQTVNHGGSTTAVSASPATGYHFGYWTDGSGATLTDNPLILTNATASRTFNVTFIPNSYTITFQTDGNGALTGTTSQTVSYGNGSATVTAVPNPGYRFVNWSGSNGFTSTQPNLTYWVYPAGDVTLTANFANSSAVTVTTAPHGALDSSTPAPAMAAVGSTTSFTFNADAHYHVGHVYGCGGTDHYNYSNDETSYTFTTGAITEPCTISATFDPNQYRLIAVASGDMNMVRSGHAATRLDNGIVLITGGPEYFNVVAPNAELYDPATGVFSATTGRMTTARRGHTATLLANGTVLIAGGDNNGIVNSSELYDPVTGTFSSTGAMGTARQRHTATLLASGKVLIIGGDDNNGNLYLSAELYDPATGTFSPTGDMTVVRPTHTATRLPSGKVLVVGGEDDVNLASAELFDPTANAGAGAFTATAASMNSSRSSHTATLLATGQVLIAGGWGGVNGDVLASAELYDPTANAGGGEFTVIAAPMTSTRYNHTATPLANGQVLMTGGWDQSGVLSAGAELYDPVVGAFSSTGSLPKARSGYTVTLLGSGKVLLAGGVDDSWNELNSAELYDPAGTVFSSTALGSIDAAIGGAGNLKSDVFTYDMSVQLTATPVSGHHFVNWTGTGGFAATTANPLTVSGVTTNMFITANFAINSLNIQNYTVTPSAGNGGSISPNIPQSVINGATTQFTVTPNSGYTASLGGTCGGTLSGTTYTTDAIAASCTVEVSFTLNSYTVAFSSGANGTITCDSSVTFGSTSVCTITPAAGYHLATFTDAGTDKLASVINSSYTITNVTAGHTISGTFTNTYTLSVNKAGMGTGAVVSTVPDGTINCGATCSVSYVNGTSVTLTAAPDSGSIFTGWFGACSGTDSICQVTVDGNKYVTAGFRKMALSAGTSHSLVLRSDGTVWASGRNNRGQLGNGTTTNSSTPVQVIGLTSVIAISAGSEHSVALKYDGTVWAWGYNGAGQLGDGTTTSRSAPVQVKGVGGTGTLSGVTAIAAGYDHTLALKNDGTVWGWGPSSYGQLGVGTTTGSATPIQVKNAGGTGTLSGVTAIAAGHYYSAALKSDGTVWTWGGNSSGQLGDGSSGIGIQKELPVQVKGVGGSGFLSDVMAIAIGDDGPNDGHTLALKKDGTVWTWGNNDGGQLGNGTVTDPYSPILTPTPVQVKGVDGSGVLSGITSIYAGTYYSMAIRSDGAIFVWGWNSSGQFGYVTVPSYPDYFSATPVQISGLSEVAVLAAGASHVMAIKSDGTILAWGDDTFGQFGNGATANSPTPLMSTFSGLVAAQTIGAISFTPPTVISGGTTIASATATSGLGVVYTSITPNVCTVSGAIITAAAPGTCTIAANQSGNVTFGAAAQVTGNLTVTSPVNVPGAPTGVTATDGNAQATISFTAPASNGGSPVTGYSVTSSPGGVTATGTASPIIVSGLANGTSYTFTVTATNSVGTGAASVASNSVTPALPVTVTYNGNGSTGGNVPSDATVYTSGATVTALGTETLVNTGYTFAGWNTSAAGTGTSYTPGSTFTMVTANVTLYAQWTFSAGVTPGTISGKLTNVSGTGIPGIRVAVFMAGGGGSLNWSGGNTSDANGNYFVSGLPAGDYKIQFNAQAAGYDNAWYTGRHSSNNADTVTLSSTNSAVADAVLSTGTTFSLSGKVTSDGINGIANVGISANDYATGAYLFGTSTDASGNYSLNGFVAGSYKINFGANNSNQSGWYNGTTTPSYSGASLIPITTANITGINVTLAQAGAISGKVTSDGSTGIANLLVAAWDYATNNWIGGTSTASDGTYTIHGLLAGNYKVFVDGSSKGYNRLFYGGASDATLATSVTVTGTDTTTGKDVTLVTAGSISGTVTRASDGVGISSISVTPFDATSGTIISYASVTTNSLGQYAISGLPAGNYKVQFYGNNSGYILQYYNNRIVGTISTADAVTVTAGNTATINTTLTLGGKISGTVTNFSGVGISGVNVRAYDASTNSTVGMAATTDTTGSYTIVGLPTGAYKVRFNTNGTGTGLYYSRRVSGDGLDLNHATSISVSAPATVTGIDATLPTAGAISGKATNESGIAVSNVTVIPYFSVTDTEVWSMRTTTDTNGNYSIGGLDPGSYKILFSNNSTLQGGYYNTKPSPFVADQITVTANNTTTGIDGKLSAPTPVSLSFAGVEHAIQADGTEFDQFVIGINSYAANMPGLVLTASGPSGFSYTFKDSEIIRDATRTLVLLKRYPTNSVNGSTPVPLAAGSYTFTLTDALGNISTITDTHVTVTNPLPIVDSSTILYQGNADGSYHFSWTPVSGNYYYRVTLFLDDGFSSPVYTGTRSLSAFADIPSGVITSGRVYKVRVDVFDAQMFSQVTNRSYSALLTFSGSNSQTITFGSLAARTYGNSQFGLSASASSGLAVSYSSSDPTVASISGTTVTILKSGTTAITASQAGNFNYTAATSVVQLLVINPATPTVSITNSPVTYNGSAQTATVACLGGGTATLASGGTGTNAGSYPATVNCAASTNYAAATGLNAGSFVINPATPTASITNSPVTYNGTIQTAAVACLGGGTATLASGGTGTDAGSYPVTVNCAASANYSPATGLNAGSFAINPTTPTASIINSPVIYNGTIQTAAVACLGGGTATLSGGTGTNAGSYPVTVNCAASSNYSPATGLNAGSFVINPATPTAIITNSPVTFNGSAQTATVACLGGGTATLATGGTGTDAGSYPAMVNCAASSNYSAATILNAGSFVINSATPTASITNSPVTFNGSAQTATVTCLGGGAATLSGGTGTNAGSYPATVNCAASSNYSPATGLAAGNFVINPATPTASITNSSVSYNGIIQTAAVACLGGGTATLASGGTGTNAGSYPATVNCAASANYAAATGLSAGNFVINPATPTASITNSPVTYNGSAQTATVACLGGGTATLTSGGTGTDAGSYPVTVNCAASSNYAAATGLNAGSFVINPATPTASITNSPVTFNGSTQTATVACLGGGTATLATGGAGTNVGSYPTTVDCAASSNYSAAAGLPAGNFLINPATPTASIINSPVTYNGSAQTATVSCLGGGAATLSGGTGTNAGSYPATVSCAVSANYSPATGLNAGSFVINPATPTASITNSPVTFNGSAQTATVTCLGGGAATIASGGTGTNAGSYPTTIDCAASSNYSPVTGLNAGRFVINPATPTASITNSPVTFNGSAQTATVACLGGGAATLASGGTGTNAGSYPATANCAASTNYSPATGLNAGSFVINPATPTASIINSPVIFNGSAQTATVACLGGGTATIASGGTGTNAGSYPTAIDCAASSNYSPVTGLNAASFVINPATPTASITNSPVTFNGSAQTATVTCLGGGAATLASGGTGTNAGSYPTTVNCAASSNYSAVTGLNAASFVINPATPTASIINSPVTFNGSAQTATVACLGGSTATLATGGTGTDAGSYPATVNCAASSNYAAATGLNAGSFVINPATPIASIINSPVTYNGSAQTATVTCLGGGAATIASGGTGTNAGSYPTTVNCAASSNYSAATGLAAGNFVINPATPTASITNSSVSYNGTIQTAVVACLGGGTATLASGGTGTNAGSYPVTVNCAASANYSPATGLNAGSFVINPATPIASIINSPVTFNGSAQTATVTCLGGGAATLSGGTGTNAGSYPATVSCAVSTNYAVATGLSAGNFEIKPANQSLVIITGPPSVTFGTTGTATASGGSGAGSYIFSTGSSTGCTVAGNIISVLDASGTCTLTVTRVSDTNYYVSNVSADYSVTLIKSAQSLLTVTGVPVTAQLYGATFTVASSGGSGTGAVSFSATGACYNSGALVTMTSGTGTCSVTATKTADSNYGSTTSAAATVNAALPVTVPGAPTAVTAVAGNAQATINFVAPASTGGSPITGYTVTSSPGSVTATGTASPIVVTGLVNGTSYTFSVTAANSAGTGTASVASNSVITSAPLVVANGTTTTVTTNASGQNASTIALNTPGAAVNIPAGTAMTDAAGNPVTGPLTMTATASTSISSLPTAEVAGRTADGRSIRSMGGFIDINISSVSGSVKRFATPITVNIALSPSFAIPGSALEYFSFDGTIWNMEGAATVKADGTLDMQVSHLSIWAVAKFSSAPTGDVNGDGKVDIADALKALQFAVGIGKPAAAELANGDVAPLVSPVTQSNGVISATSSPNGVIDLGDSIAILQKAIGIITW